MTGGEDDHRDDREHHRGSGSIHEDQELERDHAWADFRKQALRDRERYREAVRYDREFRGDRNYGWGNCDFGCARDFNRARDVDRVARDHDYGGRAFDRDRRFRADADDRREPLRPPKIQFPNFNGEVDPLT